MQTTTPAHPIIQPKPRALKPVKNVLTGLIHAVVHEDTAYWSLILRNRGTETTRGGHIHRTRNTNEQLTSAAILQGLETAVDLADGDHLSLYINDKTVRVAISGLSLDNITLEPTIEPGDIDKAIAHTAKMAGTSIATVTPIGTRGLTWAQRDAQRARLAKSHAPVLVSSDASMGRRTKDAGLGFVIDWPEEDPTCVAATAKSPSILTAELLAIELAVKEVTKTIHSRRQVLVNSDSQIAITGINDAIMGKAPSRMNSSQAGIVDRIVHLCRHYNVTFSWVKGHNNDRLNEVADRLAVGARRCKEMGLPIEVRNDIVEQIRESVHLPLAS